MKQCGQLLKQARRAFCKIHLVDKCLLLFMAILLIQSAYSLIAGGGVFSEADHIDIIVRTSTAAIFGYFLSANFIRHSTSRQYGYGETPQPLASADAPSRSSVPIHLPPLESDPNGPGEQPDGSEEAYMSSLQTITAAAIGLFCLVVLILVRNFADLEEAAAPSVTATVAQLRDFVSGSVGFLLGSPTSGGSGNQNSR